MEQFLLLISEVGFPVASAIGAGWGIFILVRFFLKSVTERLDDLDEKMLAAATNTTELNADMAVIDVQISEFLGLKPDLYRAAKQGAR